VKKKGLSSCGCENHEGEVLISALFTVAELASVNI
jgi:hypothetical protein